MVGYVFIAVAMAICLVGCHALLVRLADDRGGLLTVVSSHGLKQGDKIFVGNRAMKVGNVYSPVMVWVRPRVNTLIREFFHSDLTKASSH